MPVTHYTHEDFEDVLQHTLDRLVHWRELELSPDPDTAATAALVRDALESVFFNIVHALSPTEGEEWHWYYMHALDEVCHRHKKKPPKKMSIHQEKAWRKLNRAKRDKPHYR